MIRALITPLTMYQIDNTVFDGVQLPTRPLADRGYDDLFLTGWDMDKTVFINNLLMETAELNVLYTNPQFFKFAVTQWALKEKAVWQSLYETLFFKYNPIWNKDGTVKEEATETRDLMNGNTTTLTKGTTIRRTTNEDITDNDDNTTTYNTKLEDENETRVTRTPNLLETTHDNTSDDYTKNNTLTKTGTIDNTGSVTNTGTVKNTGTQTDRKIGDTETTVAAYNAATYTNRDKVSEDTTNTRTDDLTRTDNLTRQDDLTQLFDTVDDTAESSERDITNNKTVETTGNEVTATIGGYTDRKTGTESSERDYTRDREETETLVNSGDDVSETSGTDEGTIDNNREVKEFGNIGVTTTQAMIQAERDLVKFNIYDVIIESFKQRFCLLNY